VNQCMLNDSSRALGQRFTFVQTISHYYSSIKFIRADETRDVSMNTQAYFEIIALLFVLSSCADSNVFPASSTDQMGDSAESGVADVNTDTDTVLRFTPNDTEHFMENGIETLGVFV
jgi:hypothetical protein